MKRADKWRIYSSAFVLVLALFLIWPTVKWYSLPTVERDRAEASVQPETTNPYLRGLINDMQEEGGEPLLEEYRELYQSSVGTIKLGLDLQGGMYLAYTVEPTPGLDADEALDQALEIIRNRIDEFGVSEPSITRQGNDRIIVQLPGVRDPARARAIVERQALLEFKIVAYPNAEHPSPSSIPVIRAIETVLGDEVSDEVQPEPTEAEEFSLPVGGDDLTLPAPDSGDESVLPTIEVAGTLSSLLASADQNDATVLSIRPGDWVLTEGENFDAFQSIINRDDVKAILAEANLRFVFGKVTVMMDGTSMMSVFLIPNDSGRGWDRQSELDLPHYRLTGANLTDVRIRMGDPNSMSRDPYLLLEFDSEGASNWARITGENVDERVSILLDGRIYSVATIQERITGSGTRLSGAFSVEEARDLRLVLKAGSLPARLIIAEEQTIGPSLGQKAIRNGFIAGVVGLILIAIFMIIYYGASGVIAVLALLFDMLIILAFLSFPGPLARLGVTGLNATLTLPGIAGIILTIGMAVDASVLIYERIREELRSGKGIRSAVSSGYARAFVTIMDANITTFITALVLYKFGTGPIRGFAVTLSIGIMASMFCSLVFTRSIFNIMLAQVKRTKISIGKMAFVRDAHYNITGMRKKTYIASLAMILVGLIAFANGGLNLSIDFTGGLETNVISTVHETTDELGEALTSQGLESVQVQSLQDWEGEGYAFVIRSSTSEKEAVYAALGLENCTLMEDQSGNSEASFIKQIGPRVGAELRSKAVDSILMAMFFIVLYIWYRFQFKWGIAAVAALVHDVLITVGILALLQVDVSLTIIAALLTIVGYSINDTIVVFDRIREDNRLRKGKTFEETVNHGINETLSRTIVTSATTFIAVLMLFVFGTGDIRNFALTLMIGIFVGTYSSVFVASPILIDWHARLKRK